MLSVLGTMDYCEGETFRAICEPDEVVVMRSASYGRMHLGRCLRIDYGNIGCFQDILTTMDAWCSGRRNCEVKVSGIYDVVRNYPQDCPSDLRGYLEATYQCIKGKIYNNDEDFYILMMMTMMIVVMAIIMTMMMMTRWWWHDDNMMMMTWWWCWNRWWW